MGKAPQALRIIRHNSFGTSILSEFDLDRFVHAQRNVYEDVVAELSAGKKRSHWMWFIFPQIVGLGSSVMAQRYAIRSRAEAQAYLDHDLLGRHLDECTRLVLAVEGASITDVLGQSDDVKFRSSMTLFAAVSQRDIFTDAIRKYFSGGHDFLTTRILGSCS